MKLMQSVGIFSLAAVLTTVILIQSSFAVNINTCQTLNANTYYALTASPPAAAGTCFIIAGSNILLDGKGYTVTYAQSTNDRYGVDNTGGYTNITIRNVKFVQSSSSSASYAIYFSGALRGTIWNNTINTSGSQSRGVYLEGSDNINVSNNTITTSGDNGEAISLEPGVSNNISGNVITTYGTLADGLLLFSGSMLNNVTGNRIFTAGVDSDGVLLILANSNTFLDNYVTVSNTGAFGVDIISSSSNKFIGGSFFSKTGGDYYLENASTTNNFKNTNFTVLRKIEFDDASSWFNYNNEASGNIWLKTKASSASSINRVLATWSQSMIKWNDTSSISGQLTYGITGLLANMQYTIRNTTGSVSTIQTLTTDASGNLPSFTMKLNGNTEIIVISATSIISCGDLTMQNTYYKLIQNVASPGTCFTIKANNITLDGQGYTVNYDQSINGFGVDNTGGYDNTTIKNVNFIQANSGVIQATAIIFYGVKYGNITNNTMAVSGGSDTALGAGDGVGLYYLSNFN